MFKEFGEFDSAAEINAAAERLLEEGDRAGVVRLAEENGIDREDAEAYADGQEYELCSELMAAWGKIAVEEKDLEVKGILMEWTGIIKDMCTEIDGMAAAVRSKKKKLLECMAQLIRYSFEKKVKVSDKIVESTKINVNGKEKVMKKPLYLGVPNRAEARGIIRGYYMDS